MAETNFPNGISVEAGHVGLVAPFTATGLRQAAGSAAIAGGSANVASGLTSVLYAQVTRLGPLAAGAGTAGAFVTATAQPSGANIIVRGYDVQGTVSDAAGTVFWHAIGT